MQKLLAKVLLFIMVLNLFPIYNTSFAVDTDSTANIDLTVSSSVITSSIIGRNFSLDISLTNESTSDGNSYNPGFIIKLPENISFVSSLLLGVPTKSIDNVDGSSILFFETSDLLVKSTTKHYSLNLVSELEAELFTNTHIEILAYVEDNIYGRGGVPTGAPIATLPGGVDLSNGNADIVDLSFPDNIVDSDDLSGYIFNTSTTKFVPFDVTKESTGVSLIGKPFETTITIFGNDLGDLNNFHIEDVIPNNRKFVGFTQSGSIGNINVEYNTPGNGQVTLDLDNIFVASGTDLEIKYLTLPLAFPISSYSGTTILLNTGSVISDRTSSINTATMISDGTWNNGITDVIITSTGVIEPQSVDAKLGYAILGKSVDNSSPVIGDIVTYTINLDMARNVSFGTGGVGTYITDFLPDGLSFSGVVSSTNSGVGNTLTYISHDTDADGDTIITWRLNSGELLADDTITIVYQALVDGDFEGAGEMEYENTESLVNLATFTGTISDSTNDEEWGYTDPSIIGTTVTYSATAQITAPNPTNEKRLISIEFPDSTIYDSSNPLPADTGIPVDSKLIFAVIMDFPNVVSTGSIITDALPLLMGPNDSVYDIAFQTNENLDDFYGDNVPFNDNDGDGNADTIFNTLVLSGSTIPNSSWISTSPANNIDFNLGNGVGNKTFSIVFSVDVLPFKPSGYNNDGFLPIKNVSIASFKNDSGSINNLEIEQVPFDIALPSLEITKSMSGTNIESNSFIDYTVEITNTGEASAFLEDIVDTLPDNLNLDSYNMTGSGFTVSSSSITQSGSTLNIEFDTIAPLSRSVLSEKTSIIIDYRVKVGTGIFINTLDKTNTITLDYYSSKNTLSNELYNFGPITSNSSFTTNQPTLTRTLISTSETGSITNDLEIGEEATFETIITLPGGSYDTSSFLDIIDNSYLTYITGSIVSVSPGLVLDNPSGNFSIIGDELNIDFGNIVNNDTDTLTPETIVIHTTEMTKVTTQNNVVTSSQFTTGSNSVGSSNVNVDILEPNIILNKSVLTDTGDSGDVLDYTISLTNNGNANAYDLVLKDTLDSRFTFNTGSLVFDGFSGTEADFLSSTGITLDQLDISGSKTITFQVIVNNNVAPLDTIPNMVDLSYDSLNENDSPNEKDYTTDSVVNFSVTNITIDHNLISTNNVDTGTGLFTSNLADVHIGEQVTYKTTLNIPEATYTGMTITQEVPDGFKFLSGSIGASTLAHSLSGIEISLSGSTITYTLGDITNLGSAGNKTIDLYSELIVLDLGTLIAGSQKGLSTVVANWSGIHSATDSTNLDIVEPNIVVTKDYDITSGDGGDTAITTITIQNTGTSPAYDLTWTDEQPTKVTTTGVNFTTSSGAIKLDPGDSITYTYNTTLDNTVTAGELLTGTASVDYTSAPLINSDERIYDTVTNTDTIQVIVPGGLIATLDTVQNVKIGDVSSYTIRVPIAEGTTNTLQIDDIFPSGIAVDTSSIIVTASGGLTYTGSDVPTITSTGMVWNYSSLVNSNSSNGITEYLTINFDTVLLNSFDNMSLDSKFHDVKALYNSIDEKSAVTNSIVVVEPSIDLNITSVYNHENTMVKYTFTLTNSGTVDGYDLNLETLMPAGVTYSGAINIINSGGVTNLQRSSNIFTIDGLDINTGNPLIFEINAIDDGNHSLGDVLTLTGNLEYTSQDGNYIEVISGNSDNTERTGIGGINNYVDTDITSFIFQNAILNEDISIVDDNGGDHLGGEIYTYTVTLTNTGNVLLTDIPVSIDIPEYLSGSTFVLDSIPGGSSFTYTSTGGVNTNGQLSVTGIDIPVGESRTIVYKIKTLELTPDGTNISTEAQVGNSTEGAIGGIPNIDFVVVAPKLETTSIVTDINGGKLYVNDYIKHTATIENIGSSTGTNVQIELSYNTGTVSYQSGSLEFQAGSLVNTGSINIDEVAGIISFTLTSLPVSGEEVFIFKTKAIGVVGDTVETIIDGIIDEGFDSTTTSNKLIIVKKSSSSGSSGSGGGGGSSSSTVEDEDEDEDDKNIDENIENEDVYEEIIIEEDISIEKPTQETLEKNIKNFEEQKNLLEDLLKIQETEGKAFLKALPKVLPKTGTPIDSRVATNFNSKVNTTLPDEEIFALAGNTQKEIEYWTSILPEEDKNKDKYIVIPSNGLVVPINSIGESDINFDNMINGREIQVNNYLKDGVLEYPGTSTLGYGELGNKVIFGHSSYWKNDDGRYQTHFQKIIELDKNEEVRVYEKQSDGTYSMFTYIVAESYNTDKSDVDVLNPGKGQNLTLFTCTPIGGVSGRWIIKAKYVDEVVADLNREVYFTDVSIKYKRIIRKIMKKITDIENPENRTSALYNIYSKVDIILDKYDGNEKITRVFELLKLELSRELLK